MNCHSIQYVHDENGIVTAVLVPIDIWRDMESENETAYLLKSDSMARRLIEAKERTEAIPFEVVRERLGV